MVYPIWQGLENKKTAHPSRGRVHYFDCRSSSPELYGCGSGETCRANGSGYG